VSHILNGQVHNFSEGTVQRVREAAASLGYVPSAAGRTLVRGRSDLVVLVVPNMTLTNVQDLIEAIAAELYEVGHHLVVHFGRPGPAGRDRAAVRYMVEALRPAGLIDLGSLSRGDLVEIHRQGCPVLFPVVDGGGADDESNRHIARLQAEHLVDRGAGTLAYAFVTDRRDDVYGPQRAEAVTEFCAERGLAIPSTLDVPLDRDGARDALRVLLERTGPGVGMACSNDEVALALTFAALGLGVAVPRDVAVIGVGGGSVSQLVTPRVTTVALDVRAAVSSVRQAVAFVSGSSPNPPAPATAEIFSVVQGETT
jgi:DNA-binding LacI/PurR family transcriptional regulator